MLTEGFVKIYRKILDHPLVTQLPATVLKVWIICLVRANWQPTKWYDGKQEIDIPAGAFIFSQDRFAKECHVSRHQLRTALFHLQNLHCVAIRSTNRYSLLIVEKWSLYQLLDMPRGQVGGQQRAIEGPTSGQQAATEEEVKKLRMQERLRCAPEWPETTWAVAERFETDDRFVMRLVEESMQAVLSFDGDPKELTDSSLARIVRDAIERKPDGKAGLLFHTVPAIIESRLKRAKRAVAASEAIARRRLPPEAS